MSNLTTRPVVEFLAGETLRVSPLSISAALGAISALMFKQRELRSAIDVCSASRTRAALACGADASRPFWRYGKPHLPLCSAIHQRKMGGTEGLAVLELLLDAGADPGSRFHDKSNFLGPGRAPLHPLGEPALLRALRIGDLPCCEVLLARGADPDAQDDHALSARSYAARHAATPWMTHDHSQTPICDRFLLMLSKHEAWRQAAVLESQTPTAPSGSSELRRL